ncbi:hypothetical protein CHS0354_029312, partial [Potamilus streckersoni]
VHISTKPRNMNQRIRRGTLQYASKAPPKAREAKDTTWKLNPSLNSGCVQLPRASPDVPISSDVQANGPTLR